MENIIQTIAILAPPLLLALTLHEFAHAWVADKLGDPTPRFMGRLTLNPLKHLDPMGTLAFILTRMIGWAKPVPVNPRNFKNPHKAMMWVALAGPLTNLFLASVSAILLKILLLSGLSNSLGQSISEPLFLMLIRSVQINVGLAIFNLIPLPPLDGGRIMTGLLPMEKALVFSRIEPYGPIILIFLIFSNILNYTLIPIIITTSRLLLG